MRKLKIVEHISLDGVIQVSGEDGDFPYGDWTASYRTPAGREAIIAAHGGSFDLLLARRTYDIWSGFWPKAPSSPMADGFNAATKYIATHRPGSLAWGPFEGLGPDIVEGIRRIKSQDGPDLILSGSSTLTSTLLEHGLADEVLLVGPVGHGEALLCEGNPATLVRARQHESNAVRHHPQYLQGRRAFENRIVRRREILSQYRNA
jgi:dihydrofolate reductase